ncbi:hypothetical protein L873DRAFT_45850 [Choiromyces venosus 120613-1]|uniref:Uncharacterized protein n=1 Tax=Choiromyces venosus 120613-1 TaxID=1336337 RepID=A0A3N4K6H2_9PEZI|nr:hypothetical protein L873DRAFT_45850 [Choiromyces venosus 120613-1]
MRSIRDCSMRNLRNLEKTERQLFAPKTMNGHETDSVMNASTRNFLTFVNTTAIAYGQKIGRSLKILMVCNSSCVHKRQKITSRPQLSHSYLKPDKYGLLRYHG